MALINCPDCGRQVSTEALACPGCGRPVKSVHSSWSPPGGATGAAPAQHASAPVVVQAVKSRGVFIILGVLLGLLGIHNFYAGYYGRGAVQLIITLVLGWVGVGIVITGVWMLIELFVVKVDAQGRPMC